MVSVTVSSSKFKPGIVALFAIGVVQQATALPQITGSSSRYMLKVEGHSDECGAVAAALNSLTYGSSSISGVHCTSYSSTTFSVLKVEGTSDECEAVAAALNSLTYGASSISGVYCYTDNVVRANLFRSHSVLCFTTDLNKTVCLRGHVFLCHLIYKCNCMQCSIYVCVVIPNSQGFP